MEQITLAITKKYIELQIHPADYDIYNVELDLQDIDDLIANLLQARKELEHNIVDTELKRLHKEFNKQQMTVVQLRKEISDLKRDTENK